MDMVFENNLSSGAVLSTPCGFHDLVVDPNILEIKEHACGIGSIEGHAFKLNVISWGLICDFKRYRRGDNFLEFQIIMNGRIHRMRQFNSIFFSEFPEVEIHRSSQFGRSQFNATHPVTTLIPELNGTMGELIVQIRPFRSRAFEIFEGDNDYLQLFRIGSAGDDVGFHLAILMLPVVDLLN